MKGRGERSGTILFLSEVSDRNWPIALAEAFPDHRIATSLEDADPSDTVAALVWNHRYGSLAPYRNLRVLINLGAGVDHIVGDPALPPGVPIVRLVDPGLTARMAEYVLMHCLALHRRVPEQRQAQAEARWAVVAPTPPAETCVGILGLGNLGAACAKFLSQIGFNVIGWRRTQRDHPEFQVHSGESELPAFCAAADIVVALLPLTRTTRGLLDNRFFSRMRRGSALINVGRGDLVVEEDLLAALDGDALRHAVLDVFKKEPLPSDHSFWRHPKITISPHNSSATNPATALEQVADNIKRSFAGKTLLNRVDPEVGY